MVVLRCGCEVDLGRGLGPRRLLVIAPWGSECQADFESAASRIGITPAIGSAGLEAGAGGVRRRIRAVTGSSAVLWRVPVRAGVGLDGVGGFQGLDPLGEFGDGGRGVRSRLRARLREAGLELVA